VCTQKVIIITKFKVDNVKERSCLEDFGVEGHLIWKDVLVKGL
jgi:hypothetical protein